MKEIRVPRRIVFILAGLLVLAGITVTIALVDPLGWRASGTANSQNMTSPKTSPGTATTDAAAIKNANDAKDAAAALARLAADPVSVASSDIKAKVGADPGRAVPPGTEVAPQPQSWAPDGLGGGTMPVAITLPGGSKKLYLALMVKEGEGWKVTATWPINTTPPAKKAP